MGIKYLKLISKIFLVIISILILFILSNEDLWFNENLILDYKDHLALVNKTCSYPSPDLEKNYKNEIDKNIYSFKEIKKNLDLNSIKLVNGGKSFTKLNSKCDSSLFKYKKIAFIVPYRDRLTNLKVFLNNIHRLLTSQKINYGIYLIEPVKNITFNRGLLMNIGFIESIKDSLNKTQNINLADLIKMNTFYDCWIFHDVDMIPEDKRLLYTCDQTLPIHLAVAVKKFNYNVEGYYSHYFGGITGFTMKQYTSINGFSNLYFGWGVEDDDLLKRCLFKFKKIKKLNKDIARIYTHDHQQDVPNPERFNILGQFDKRIKLNTEIGEGLNTLNYIIDKIEKNYLFTRIIVNYDKNFYDLNFKNVSHG